MLRVEDAVVRLGGASVLDGISLEVGAAETVAVLGPSGCGKSTLLRAVAGLEQLDAGRVSWDGSDLAPVPAHARGFGLMFQDYALFPHRDVRGNVEFGLRMSGASVTDRRERVDEVLELVGLTGFGSRRVTHLSGGEQQRVALARTLAPRPRLLMLDEPLGSLDRALHDRLLDELGGLLAAAALPTLYVTHDHEEAFALAGRMVVMREGRVAQQGAPSEIWRHPIDEWTAGFLGFPPAVDATVAGGALITPWGPVPSAAFAPDGTGDVRLVLRPGALRVDGEGGLVARIEQIMFRGERSVARVVVGDGPPLDVAVESADGVVGRSLRVSVDPAAALVYPSKGP